MAEILGKLAEEIAIDFRSRLRRVNGEMNVVSGHQGCGRKKGQQAKNGKDATCQTSLRSTGTRWSAEAGAPVLELARNFRPAFLHAVPEPSNIHRASHREQVQ